MSNFKETIYKFIEKNNNNNKIISKSSIKTYTNYIYKLYKEFNNDNEFEPEFFLTNYKEVLKYIDNLNNDNSKKSYIASILFVLKKFNDNNDIFKKNIYLEYIENTKKKIDDIKLNQEKNDKEEKNWITQDDIKIIYNDMYKIYYPLLQKYKTINTKDYQKIQNFIIISLYYLNMPRRLMDYTELKISEYDKNKDNYIYKKQFIFNIFKTSKYYENNKVDINNELYNILNLFILYKKNNNELNQNYLLESDNNKKLNSVNLNKRLNKIFGNKNISVNILRKSYLSSIYKNIPSLKEINNISNNMSNSFKEQLISYVKK